MILLQKMRLACSALCFAAWGLGRLYLSADAQEQSKANLQAASVDLSTPQKTIETFVAAIKKNDIAAAAKCVVNGKPIHFPWHKDGKGPDATIDITLSNADYKTEGDKAVFTGTGSITGGSHRYPLQEKLELKKMGAEWKIVAPEKPGSGYLTLFAMMSGHPEFFKNERAKAREKACLSNLRQVALGCVMLAQDFDEKFALKAQSYKTSLFPYMRNEQVFHCSLDASGKVSYAFNSSLAGLKLSQIKKPAITVMVYEGAGGKLTFRHTGKAGVGFADGHAKMVTAEEAKSLRWQP